MHPPAFDRSRFITLPFHLLILALLPWTAQAQDIPQPLFKPAPAAPTPPAIQSRLPLPPSTIVPFTTQYSIGSPTDEEQQYVEMINRARANAPAEGARLATSTDPDVLSSISFFGVDLAMLQTEFNAIAAVPPVSINAALTNAARGHSDWMFTNAVQSHTGSGGSDPGTRITAAGYTWTTYGENIFAYANSVTEGHAGFEIDWGTGTGGMQGPPRGHRVNIHTAGFREIGVGVKLGTNTVSGNTVGPQLVTQDFATASGATPFVTGVAYYDLNGNGFYDPGEGIGGVTVNVSGANYYAVTANSGGYSVPVPAANTSRTVTFSGLGFNFSTSATIASLNNVKTDYVPTYVAPTVTGPAIAYTGGASSYSFNAINGATQYGWRYAKKSAAAAEGCDSLTNASASNTSYIVVDTGVKDSGTASFHLAQPSFTSQYITLSGLYYPAASSSMVFRSRLSLATSDQVARVQISTDNGTTWTDLYTQAGSNGSGEASFNTRTVSLSSYVNTPVRLRFAYTFTSGSAYTQTSSGVGWYVDTITFTNTSQLSSITAVEPIASNAFSFTPATTGTYLLSARPYYSGHYGNYGPATEITVNAGLYEAWASPIETTNSLPASTLTNNPSADYNGDGVPNILAYALGLSPVQQAASQLPQGQVSGGSLRVSYPKDTAKSDITLTPQASVDLVTWYDPGAPGAPAGFADALVSTAGTVQTRSASVPLSSGSRLFLRLKVTRP